MTRIVPIAAVLALAGCSLANTITGTAPGTKVTPGQLFCAFETATGPFVATIVNAAGLPVLVTNLAATVVANACKQWNVAAVPVVPAVGPVPSVAIPNAPANALPVVKL